MAHLHNIYDTDTHFSINPITRAIKNESSTKTTLMQGDHNSERFTFEVPRFIEGHDMAESSKIEIHFINISSANKADTSANVYICDDVQISPDSDDVVIFSWLVSGNATKYDGQLAFKIRFVCLFGTSVDYAWNTAMHNGISVGAGIDNGESVIEQYSDVLATWEASVNEAIAKADEVNAALDNKIDKITNKTDYGKVLYFPGQSSTPTAIGLDTRVLEGGVVRRKFEQHAGHIELPDLATNPPTLPNLAVSKEYVDPIIKRVDKLEGMLITDIIDSTEAYAKRVPPRSVPKAMLNRIGGKTIKKGSKNICTDAVEGGCIETVSAGGGGNIFYMSLPAGTYYIDIKEEVISGSLENELWIWQDYNANTGWFSNGVNTFENDVDLWIEIENFSGTEDYVCKVFPTIVQGTEAPEGYEPYEAPSLEATKVTEIVSRGRNLVKHIGWYGATTYGTVISTTDPVNTLEVTQTRYIPREEEGYSGDYRNGYVYYKFEGSLIGGRRYKVSFDIDIKENPLNYDKILLNLQGGQGTAHNLPATGKGKVVGVLVCGTNPDTIGQFDIRCMGMSFTLSNVMITNENADISTYSPYIAETYKIPEEIQNKEGYGTDEGYIDFDRKKWVYRDSEEDISDILTDYPDYKFINVEGDGELIAKNENETETAIPWTVTFAEV